MRHVPGRAGALVVLVVAGAAVVVGGATVEEGLVELVELVSAADVLVVVDDELACRPTGLSPHDDPRIAALISNATNRTIHGRSRRRR